MYYVSIKIDTEMQRKGAEKRWLTGTPLQAVAENAELNSHSRQWFKKLLNLNFDNGSKSIGEMMQGKRFLEPFSGCGRFYDLYIKYRPKEILMVDINKHSIAHAKSHCPGIKAICNDVLSWSR